MTRLISPGHDVGTGTEVKMHRSEGHIGCGQVAPSNSRGSSAGTVGSSNHEGGKGEGSLHSLSVPYLYVIVGVCLPPDPSRPSHVDVIDQCTRGSSGKDVDLGACMDGCGKLASVLDGLPKEPAEHAKQEGAAPVAEQRDCSWSLGRGNCPVASCVGDRCSQPMPFLMQGGRVRPKRLYVVW